MVKIAHRVHINESLDTYLFFTVNVHSVQIPWIWQWEIMKSMKIKPIKSWKQWNLIKKSMTPWIWKWGVWKSLSRLKMWNRFCRICLLYHVKSPPPPSAFFCWKSGMVACRALSPPPFLGQSEMVNFFSCGFLEIFECLYSSNFENSFPMKLWIWNWKSHQIMKLNLNVHEIVDMKKKIPSKSSI